ncbi:MAG TPA: prepilin-type N-terminal cleavage/methylation domain-containing protein [Kiritimatiellae bacterium]|nr:prepilin-type N-terminal cleavage/methylation domain-containing protein [Kiritimatiellia bacterium]
MKGTAARHGRGFTLIELMVVTVLVGVLASLLFPAINRAKARSQSAVCLSNLRQIGTALMLEAAQKEGRIYLYSPGDDDRNSWAAVAAATGANEPDLFYCPAYPPYGFSDNVGWYCSYGIRVDPPEDYLDTMGEERYLAVGRVPEPAGFLLVADTTSSGRQGLRAKQYRHFGAAWDPATVHARHDGRANGLFLDGHVESCDRNRLTAMGINAVYGADTRPGYW